MKFDRGELILVIVVLFCVCVAINGGFFPNKPDWPAQYPSVVIEVDDIRASMSKVAHAGGEVLGEPMEIPNFGQYVSFLDSQGNRNSMVQPILQK